MAVSAKAVKELRDSTGAGMMDCKRALSDADGDNERAAVLLRERGLAKAGKREGRDTSEGTIAIGLAGTAGGIVELGCETDFVARTDQFQEMGQSFAVAASADAKLTSADALLDAELDGQKIGERVSAAIAKLGENVVLKRSARLAVDSGVVGGYVHAGGKLGVLVALSGTGGDCDALARDVAMHVAAADPSPVAVDQSGIPAQMIEGERGIYRTQAEQSGKPEKVIDKIVEGKLAKFTASICLVEQAFVKDPDKTVGDLLREAGGAEVVDFVRYKLGEASGE